MESAPIAVPHAEYTRRLAERRALVRLEDTRLGRLANARLAVFLGIPILTGLAYAEWLSPWWLLVPLVGFVALVAAYAHINRRRQQVDRAVGFSEKGLARLEERWAGQGEQGTRFLDAEHPYAADLDLFGPGSLFELLCTARTRAGEETLAGWLLGPASADQVRARQAAVAELRPRLDLREDVAVLGAEVPAGVDLQGLAAWGTAPPTHFAPGLRFTAHVLAFLGIWSLIAWLFLGWGSLPFLVVVMSEIGLALWLQERVRRVIAAVDRRAKDLSVLAELVERLERERFTAARLTQLREELETEGLAASQQIARLSRLVDLLDYRRNLLFAPIAALLLWATRLAFAIEDWRRMSGPHIAGWLEVVAECEALSALASYAYDHPADPFPEVVTEGPRLVGEGLGHPLVPESRFVRNDLELGDPHRLWVVSGSNMSGKSTLLRTVGVNAVLALAGAPVRARRLTLSPLAIGATLRIQDSLQAGRSRFYAEITRVSRLVQLAADGPLPLLFLLDELLSGTNSHDRRLGAEAILRAFLDRGAIGLITTHDLALAEIADRLAPRAGNVHFEDHLEDGRLTFDYRIRPGVVQQSNALALMRAVGLEV